MLPERPTLPELVEQGAAEFDARLPGVVSRVRRSLVGVFNRIIAAGLSALYKRMDWLSDQWWPDKCDPEMLPLHAARWNRPRIAAGVATGLAHFTGLENAPIAQGTIVQRSDAVQFITTAPGFITGGFANVPVEAVVAGQLGNSAINTQLTTTTPIPNVNSVLTAFTALSGGADIETIERWRGRIMLRIRRPPQGGAAYDYEDWAREVPGVTRAWAYPQEQGAGTMVVRFVRDDDASIIPDAGAVATVQAYIDARRPATATTYVVAPIAAPQAYTIQLLPDSAAIRAAVLAELDELYLREAKPGGTMLISQEREAISTAAGETDHVLTVPNANQVLAAGHMPMRGAPTWL